jgi:hypothetical protein
MRRTVEAAPSMRGVGVVGTSIADPPAVENRWRFARPRPPLERSELVLLAVFALTSVWVLGLDVWQVVAHGRIWTGTDGVYISDQMQYLGWVSSASHSGLVADLFVVRPTAAVYLQPAVLISGGLAAIGVQPSLALLLWKPVAVVSLFFAMRAYAVRGLDDAGPGPRLTVIALALFYGCFSSVYGNFGVVGDLFPGFLSWGYPFALMAVAAAVFALLSYDRARSEGRSSWTPGLLGALAGSLHPWQGEMFVLVVAGAELFGGGLTRAELRMGLRSPRIHLATITVALALIPLAYYYGLGKLNIEWQLGQAASKHAFPALAIGLALAPLALLALLGLRGPAGFIGRSARLWPLACILIYLQAYTSQGATPLHAFDGVTLPLALLAVNGCLRAGWRRLPYQAVIATVLVAAFTLPTTYYEMKEARDEVLPTAGNPNFVTRGERAALEYLKDERVSGGVISSDYLGMTVPGYTGRHSYDGDCIWSEPNCAGRNAATSALLAGRLTPAAAQHLVSTSHARFVLLACGSATSKIESELAPLTSAIARFDCASVIQLRA